MIDLKLYDTMTLTSCVSRNTAEGDILESWDDTFAGASAIEDIIDECASQYDDGEDYNKLGKTTITWQGKDVTCDLRGYDPRELSVPLLGLIWERNGEWIDVYDNAEVAAREKEYREASRG